MYKWAIEEKRITFLILTPQPEETWFIYLKKNDW